MYKRQVIELLQNGVATDKYVWQFLVLAWDAPTRRDVDQGVARGRYFTLSIAYVERVGDTTCLLLSFHKLLSWQKNVEITVVD